MINGGGFEITNADDKYRVLLIQPLGLKYGLDAGESLTLVVQSGEPFQMFLGDDDEALYIEFCGEVEFYLVDGSGEKVESGYNLRF